MKKIDGFQCEKCGTIFSKEQQAISCENEQNKRQENAKITGMQFKNQNGKYGFDLGFAKDVPEAIMVRFSNGHGDFGRYVLEHYGFRGV